MGFSSLLIKKFHLFNHIKVKVALLWQLNRNLMWLHFSWIYYLISKVTRRSLPRQPCQGPKIGGDGLFPYIDLSMTAMGRKFGFLCWMLNAVLSVSVLLVVQTIQAGLCLPSPHHDHKVGDVGGTAPVPVPAPPLGLVSCCVNIWHRWRDLNFLLSPSPTLMIDKENIWSQNCFPDLSILSLFCLLSP